MYKNEIGPSRMVQIHFLRWPSPMVFVLLMNPKVHYYHYKSPPLYP